MKYPKWLPQSLIQGLLCCLLALLCVILAPWAYDARTDARIAKSALLHADGAIGEIRLAAKQSVTASQTTNEALKDLDSVIKDAEPLVWKFDDVADSAAGTLDAGTNTMTTLGLETAKVSQSLRFGVDKTIDKLDDAIDSVEEIQPHVNDMLDSVIPVMRESSASVRSIHRLLSDPALSGAIDNVNRLAGNAATITAHTDHYFFPPPYSGKHPIAHHLKVIGMDVLKLTPAAAGAVALAKGN